MPLRLALRLLSLSHNSGRVACWGHRSRRQISAMAAQDSGAAVCVHAATAAELQTARQALQEASGRGRRWPLPCRACCSHLICMLLIAQPSSPAPPAACRRGPWCANAAQQTSRSSTAHCSLLTTPATSSAAARLRQGWNQQQQGHHQKHQRQQKWIMLPPAAALRYGSTWRPSTQPPWAACC